MTQQDSTATDIEKETTATPDEPGRKLHRRTPSDSELPQDSSSPPSDTQALSQFVYPPRAFADEVEDEAAEGVWGYLLPLDDKVRRPLVLRKRGGCEERKSAASTTNPKKTSDAVAFLQDLSTNGTFVNDAMVGQNKHRELEDGDEVTILDEARFVFRYPRTRDTNRFRQQYRLLQQLGKGHFATVYLCVERSTGAQYAVKVFEKRSGDSQRSQNEVLHQEIGILKGVSHPNLLCLRDTFDESDGVYLVLELAPEGELFNLIISRQKFSESETRCIFIQLFEGLKYLHDRGIIHRDIKPENILVADKELTVKLGDFGLAKIIDVAPEILQERRYRKYTKAVDVWSLGVVLYICLCGFPPFSDELYTPEHPYTLAQQIQQGSFDYPSPYWDTVGDLALDLIDRMLTVNVDDRITVDECLEHPWITGKQPSVSDSTDGLTGALGKLDFSKRKLARERTLLSNINDVGYSEHEQKSGAPVKVFHKNNAGKRVHNHPAKNAQEREVSPNEKSAPNNFVNLGEQGDPVLFDDNLRKGRN
ncbi:serine/threonine-protein kinase Chk2 [Aspergillus luchuensis]|uniref:Serine/threonine-protein kinase Chk2 n=1 Tax=Aspergillus kawachii TaxID=1069201 RepID=A0A146F3P7_ASPKA|nr:serine/threonine-protein kinase Chk2 [Aspergillus luchuensis]